MYNILIHGLGQNADSWHQTKVNLKKKNIIVETPNLFDIAKIEEMSYPNLYQSFKNYCNGQKGKLNLCGLSLGGVLALSFAKENPEKVNSMILIGTPYKIPKMIFKIQNLVFHIMPKTNFEKLGLSKKDFLALTHSMENLNIARNLEQITCPTLILCGARDKVNQKSAKLLNQNIIHSTFQIIDNSQHEVNLDNPEKLASVISNFWNQL